jgi:hypothetical protein
VGLTHRWANRTNQKQHRRLLRRVSGMLARRIRGAAIALGAGAAQLAHRRGDLDTARTVVDQCLAKLPGRFPPVRRRTRRADALAVGRRSSSGCRLREAPAPVSHRSRSVRSWHPRTRMSTLAGGVLRGDQGEPARRTEVDPGAHGGAEQNLHDVAETRAGDRDRVAAGQRSTDLLGTRKIEPIPRSAGERRGLVEEPFAPPGQLASSVGVDG